MKKEKASNRALKHIVCCIILIIVFVITYIKVDAQNMSETNIIESTDEVVPLRPRLNKSLLELKRINIEVNYANIYDKPRIVEKNINYYIKENEKTLVFFSKIFGYDIEIVKKDLIKRNENIKTDCTNIASLKKDGKLIEFDNVETGIIEYFYTLIEENKIKRIKRIDSYTGDSAYIEKLIMYYTKIYTNVDTSIALSIGAAESGYYKVEYMLRKNNIYGGMANNGLIKYENIEIGVLKYIKLLSNYYFGKGLTTLNEIGRVYCPTYNVNGYKIASPHWVNLVNTAKNKYDKYNSTITIDDIIEH